MELPAHAVEPITVTPPRGVGRVIFTQRWADLTFLHWAVDPARVAPHLPPGTRPDTLDGVTYVALVPFRMQRLGLLGGPPVPYFGSFAETNVRLYSVDEQGRRGVVFVSLEAQRLAPVVVARYGPGVPYTWAKMRVTREDDRITYVSRRRWPAPRGARSRVTVRIGERLEAGPLEHFLTARWGLHLVDHGGRTRYWPNEHPQWPLHAADLIDLDDDLLAAAGFADLAARPPQSVLHSPGVPVTFGPRLR